MVMETPPKSFLYGEYQDDPNLVATRGAFNALATEVYQWLMGSCLADYRQDPVSDTLLDWVAKGLFGMERKVLALGTESKVGGAFADYSLGSLPFAGSTLSQSQVSIITLNDDMFRRAITWNTYLGDGPVFSTLWLKRRIARFLYSSNGFDQINTGDTTKVSVSWLGNRVAKVVVDSTGLQSNVVPTLVLGLSTEYLTTPLGYSINIEVSE